jgi:hypothetical protein
MKYRRTTTVDKSKFTCAVEFEDGNKRGTNHPIACLASVMLPACANTPSIAGSSFKVGSSSEK